MASPEGGESDCCEGGAPLRVGRMASPLSGVHIEERGRFAGGEPLCVGRWPFRGGVGQVGRCTTEAGPSARPEAMMPLDHLSNMPCIVRSVSGDGRPSGRKDLTSFHVSRMLVAAQLRMSRLLELGERRGSASPLRFTAFDPLDLWRSSRIWEFRRHLRKDGNDRSMWEGSATAIIPARRAWAWLVETRDGGVSSGGDGVELLGRGRG